MNETGKDFNFLGADADHEDLISMRIHLDETPTFELLQRMFCVLYLQRLQSPQYLFVSVVDQTELTSELHRHPQTHIRPISRTIEEFGLNPNGGGGISRMRSYATGTLVNVVALPGMKHGVVIVGFFQ